MTRTTTTTPPPALLYGLMKPGVGLMRRVPLRAKLLLMGVVAAIPLVIMAGLAIWTEVAQIQVARAELDGARTLRVIGGIVAGSEMHRELVERSADGAPDPAALARTVEQLRADIARVDQLARELPQLQLDRHWPAAREAVLAMTGTAADAAPAARTAAHARAVERLHTVFGWVGETSKLLFDPEPASYFLMDVVVERQVPWVDALAELRARGPEALAAAGADAAAHAARYGHAFDAAQAAATQTRVMAERLQALARTGEPALASWPAAEQAIRRFVALFPADPAAAPPAADAIASAGAGAVNAAAAVLAEAGERLETRLTERVARDRGHLAILVATCAAALLLALYLTAALVISILSGLRAVQRTLHAAAHGDLTQSTVVPGSDEVAALGRDLEFMVARLSAMVASIRSSAAMVSSTGTRLAEDAATLSERSEMQTESLQQSSIGVREVGRTVRENAESAQTVSTLMAELQRDAESGGQAMRESAQTIGELQRTSQRMGEIIGTIDQIAFRTNILALNAAVEAARAGDSGRGFAVVAAEVRALAQRSQAAAGEIRALIAASSSGVDASVTRFDTVGAAMDRLTQGIHGAVARMDEIARGSLLQSEALERVVQAIGSLDEITNQNAQVVAQTSERSQRLRDRAANLTHAVADLRLRQGSADEARALVDRALELVQRQGLAGAAATLHSAEAGFVDRDLYVFVVDEIGTYRLHGAKPAMEGKRVHEVPGIDGDRFVADCQAAAQQGGGWVDYSIVNPTSGAVQAKASYVCGIGQGLMLGCGIYKPDTGEDHAAAPAPAAAARPARTPAQARRAPRALAASG